MTAAQRLREEGRQEGRLEGREQASRAILLRLVQRRFGPTLDPQLEQRLRSASLEQVEAWSLRVFTAASLAELFAD